MKKTYLAPLFKTVNLLVHNRMCELSTGVIFDTGKTSIEGYGNDADYTWE